MVRRKPLLRRYLKMRRVRRPNDKEKLFESLTKGEKEYNFEFFKDIFILAACMGFEEGSPAPFSKTLEPIQWEIFSEDQRYMMKMIALADTKDHTILVEGDDDGDRMLKIVEGYANRGLEIIEKKINEGNAKGINRLDTIVEMLMSGYDGVELEGEPDILEQIVEET
jgi:dnd system-associated protein 4